MTQVINSLVLLIELSTKSAISEFGSTKFKSTDLATSQAEINERLPMPSLQLIRFEKCKDFERFLRRLRNAIAHKHITFSGDPDSRTPLDVIVTLQDVPPNEKTFDWEIRVTVGDLEKLSRYLGQKIVESEK